MGIELDHVIVPSRDPRAGAKLLAELLGVPWEEARGPFTPVYANDGLTFDFAERSRFESYHFCFRVDDSGFDAIFGRIRAAGLRYKSTPLGEYDMKINTRLGGKNLYWQDADSHLWEILTVSYARADSPADAVNAPVA